MNSLSLIRYADDFVIIHENINVIRQCQKNHRRMVISNRSWIQPRKNPNHTYPYEHKGNKPGFDFLGFNIRQFPVGKYQSGKNTKGNILGFKTIIQPSKEKVLSHYRQLAKIIDKHTASPQFILIAKLAPVIRGWSNYFASVCSKDTFSKLNNLLFWKLFRWGNRRHPNKGKDG